MNTCPFCKKSVGQGEASIQCDKISEHENHWVHFSCLSKCHLLANTVKVPHTVALYETLKNMPDFPFVCCLCLPTAKPLPVQLLQNGVLNISDLVKMKIWSAEIAECLQKNFQAEFHGILAAGRAEEECSEDNKMPIQVSGVDEKADDPVGKSAGPSLVSEVDNPGGSSVEFHVKSEDSIRSTQRVTQQEKQSNSSVQKQMGKEEENSFAQLSERKIDDSEKTSSDFRDIMQGMLAIIDANQKAQQVQFQNFLQVLQNQQNSGGPSGSVLASKGENRDDFRPVKLKMPEIKIPVFHGDILEWQTFWDLYSELVDKEDRFSNVEKMSFLLNHLSEKVKLAVKNIRLENDSYQTVIDILKDRYENKEKIRSAHLQSLQKLASVPKFNLEQLRNFMDTVEAHARALLNMTGDDEELVDMQCCTITPELFSKLPISLRTQMYDHGGKTVKTSLNQFRKSLKIRLEIQFEIQGNSTDYKIPESSGKLGGPTTFVKRGFGSYGVATGSGLFVQEKTQTKHEKHPSGVIKNPLFKKENLAAGTHNTEQKSVIKKCVFCEGEHPSYKCDVYKTGIQRKEKLKDSCYICLRPGHHSRQCKTRGKYACFTCGSRAHNSALCEKTENGDQGRQAYDVKTENDTEHQNFAVDEVVMHAINEAMKNQEFSTFCEGQEDVCMQTAQTILRNSETLQETPVRIFIDSGSSRTWINKKTAEKVGLKAQSECMRRISTFDSEKPLKIKTALTNFEIKGCETFIGLTGNIIHQIAPPMTLPAVPLSESDKNLTDELKISDPDFDKKRTFEIDVLIGNDYSAMLKESGRIKLDKSGIFLEKTKLGWVTSGFVKGSAKQKNSDEQSTCAFFMKEHENSKIELENENTKMLDELWKLESIGIKDPKSGEDESWAAIDQFQNSVKIEKDRVSVKWLKRDGIEQLKTNFPLAMARLKHLQSMLSKKPEIQEKYAQYFDDQLKRDMIEEVVPEMNKGHQTHYIPHFPVLTEHKTTTKMRIVYDASAKLGKNQKSLNDFLLKGPNLLSDLTGMLLRFRTHKIGIIADIEKAFLQVELQESERDLTRFLWLKNPAEAGLENNLKIFRFKRVPFGFTSSPFLLLGAIWHLLQKAPKKFENVAEKIRNDTYVDNLITGADTVEEAVKIYDSSKSLLGNAHLHFRGWNTNSVSFMNEIPKTDRENSENTVVLGLNWDTQSDTLQFCHSEFEKFENAKTKREILSCIASVFDPLNLLSCIKIHGTIFVQKLWRQKLDWDSLLTDDLQTEWSKICKKFENLSEIKIPRKLNRQVQKNAKEILVCFTDASPEAYCACLYWVQVNENETQTTDLIFTKARLCPMGGLTVPKAELMAILIGVRATNFIQKNLRQKFYEIYLFSDSQIALDWVKNEAQNQGVWINNRVHEINKHGIKFAYVPSNENPADLASKSREPGYQMDWELWWKGPHWLSKNPNTWPQTDTDVKTVFKTINLPALRNTEKENTESLTVQLVGGESAIKNAENTKTQIGEIVDILKFKSFVTMVRVTAWVLRFIRNLKKSVENRKKCPRLGMITRSKKKILDKSAKIPDQVEPLSQDEKINAQKTWIREIQKNAYPQLFTDKIKHSDLAQSLGLYLSEEGIVRCEGRLSEASLPQDAKNPILLPAHEKITQLIILSVHRQCMHAGVNYVLNQIRQKFWIVKGRQVVTTVLRQCMHCKRAHAKPFAHPKMADLPKYRVTKSPPFQHTGVDFFGPLFCRNITDNKEKKTWVVLFTCLCVRAVHLELVPDMTGQSFFNALRKFIARRGKPKIILSDNGLQFKVANRVVKLSEKIQIDQELRKYVENENLKEIKWVFIPELAPWMGGAYERLVGVCKDSLKKALGRTKLNFDELATILCEVECVVNQRPITYVSMTSNDQNLEILTPNMFLSYGNQGNLPIIEEEDPSDLDYRQRKTTQNEITQKWKIGQYYLNKFWDLWATGYLTSLRDRHGSDKFPKLKSEIFRAPEIGEIVLIKDLSLPRGCWRLGTVIKLRAGKDGLIRSADIKTAKGKESLTRPVTHLYPLELTSKNKFNSFL